MSDTAAPEPMANVWPPPELTDEQRTALLRHGYNPDLPPRGIGGPPEQVIQTTVWLPGARESRQGYLRNHVCYLDGIEIDGHEGSDLDPGSLQCLHCDWDGDEQ
jgi:hypothetical protein